MDQVCEEQIEFCAACSVMCDFGVIGEWAPMSTACSGSSTVLILMFKVNVAKCF
jgi:hypothetical protein